MKRFLRHCLSNPIVLLLLSLVIFQGCARTVLQTQPASEDEIASVSEAFARYQKMVEAACSCCLDAEADASLSVSGWFSDHTGKISGYLQAMEPGYARFVAVNTLGQPLLIFVTDGNMFTSLNIFAEKAYLGFVQSETYEKIAPPGFEPRFSYYWLTGRLQPGEFRIQAVMRAREQKKFWLLIQYAHSSTDSMVLFDPDELLIVRHVLRDDRGGHAADIIYADHQAVPGGEFCRFPARIEVSSNGNSERIEIKLSSFLDDARFSAEDFSVLIPDNFQQLLVK